MSTNFSQFRTDFDRQCQTVDDRRRTEDINSGLKDFTSLNLPDDLLCSLYAAGFHAPSPVQAQVIPAALEGYDIIARAKNGTGKTGSYLIPIIAKINRNLKKPQAIIYVPTRELANQVSRNAIELAKLITPQIGVCPIYGGTSRAEDRRKVAKAQIVVATPGRLMDLVGSNDIDISAVSMVVLDEADELIMTDMFNQVASSLQVFPKNRQTFVISATLPEAIVPWARRWMRIGPDELKVINLMQEKTLKGISQFYVRVEDRKKVRALRKIMGLIRSNQVVIFAKDKERVVELARVLDEKLDFAVGYIYGQMKQEERNQVFHDFRKGKIRLLVSTDLFNRGIDVPDVNVVFNFDMPDTMPAYLHRIGRGGRWGQYALAINFVTDADMTTFNMLENELNITIPQMPSTIDENLYSGQLVVE